LNHNKLIIPSTLLVFLLLGGITATAQKITSFNGTAKGQGTVTVGDVDKHKIYAVAINLKENGEAEITLFTDLQLTGQARWSLAKDLGEGINLKITGGVVEGNATGTGKLFLSKDGKSIAKLNIQAQTGTGGKVIVQFVATEDNKSTGGRPSPALECDLL